MSEIRCPGCGARLTIDEVAAGHGVQCSRCQRRFNVPTVEGTSIVAPPLVRPSASARGRRIKRKRDWTSAIPVLIGVTAIGVVVAVGVLLWSHEAEDVRKARAGSNVRASSIKRTEARQEMPNERKLNLNKTQQVVARDASEGVGGEEAPVPQQGVDAVVHQQEARPADQLGVQVEQVDKQQQIKEVATDTALMEAKRIFDDAVVKDLKRLIEACEEKLKSEAAAPDADPIVIQRLLKEVQQLKSDKVIPALPQFESVRNEYLDSRKNAAERLQRAYRETIAELTRSLKVEQAIELKNEVDEFAMKEGLLVSEAKVGPPAPAPAGPVPAGVISFNFSDEIERFVAEVYRVAAFETGAMRDKEHREMMGKFNRGIASRTARFHFPITEVETQDGERFTLRLGWPEEAPKMGGVSVDLRSHPLAGRSAKQAAELRRGDILEIWGKPIFLTQEGGERFLMGKRAIQVATIRFGVSNFPVYEFHLTDYESAIRKKRENENEGAADAPPKKASLPPALQPVMKAKAP
jgi:hypothetical protein